MTREEIRNSYLEHAALTQLHRWYLPYENPEARLEHQLDILASDVMLRSGLGEARGHDAYSERVKQIPKHWDNAHRVRDTRIDIAPDGIVHLSASVTYLNRGILPDGAIRIADLLYTTELKRTEGGLPKFTRIEIAQRSESTGTDFEDLYPHNRLLGLAHAWLARIEDPRRDPEPVRELLTEDAVLRFSSGTMIGFDGFSRWLSGPCSQVVASRHRIENISHLRLPDGNLELSMTFDWDGILPDDRMVAAKSRHRWTIADDPSERFARIRSIDVEMIQPFAPKAED